MVDTITDLKTVIIQPKRISHSTAGRVNGNSLSVKRTKVDALTVLARPFKIPGPSRTSIRTGPIRSTRKRINYAENTDPNGGDTKDEMFEGDDGRYALGNLDINKFPVFAPKDVKTVLSKKFTVPFKQKPENFQNRPPPALGMRRKAEFVPRALHDPSGEFAIVLYDPTVDDGPKIKSQLSQVLKKHVITGRPHRTLNEILGIGKENKKQYPKVPVVIDPRLSKVLRPHQVEGVKFLYQCVTGMIEARANGCIMADEMGLGKTLQCIALMWTLLKQSPQGVGTIDKCVIVCPSSLVRNWANELVKWLGKDAVTPFAVDGKSTKAGELAAALRVWAMSSGRQIVRPVLIISYETLRRNVRELKDTQIGLLLCDEGHRLKNGESLTFTALDSLNVQRRVILSGTPIQNDLSEYFSLINFANPSLLGTRMEFRKYYELAILRGRDADATDKDVEEGNKKLIELSQLVSKFIIRRTNDILSKYLPVKYEHVVFCELAPFQKALYNYFIKSPEIKKLLKGVGSQPLKAIGLLKKLCNHPDLLNLPEDLEGCDNLLPDDFVAKDARGRDREVKSWYSGKFMILERMLARMRRDTNDKIVLISNYTQTLDLVERLCRNRRYGCLRLDGTMNVNKRQKLVDKFNDPEGEEFIFLLSSKAGGCGLNLIGANRLVLIDPDWNPAADQQALARVWRDGQKKDCFVYRFITTGTIEEKIFQRQSMKQSLSTCVVDEAQDVERLFSIDNLRQLFEFNPSTKSETHETFKCKRCKNGKQFIKAPAMLYGDATSWNHFENHGMEKIEDLLLRQEVGNDQVSFVFQYISH
ncbi:DNA repair protein, SNF2 family [Nadsonia fulvescens var. elongata DSM 6958]|uniref:DNA repair protein, SNF2 family n=1 Tax=Nadsonia fulvescens var. elongata DSM 6958 TaxID=857566 RepID=A0A1E3PQ44_9ASCO|nr:DNA repair protein, SNF2 family [Nadsonia fulvescens var. elongata DSM 6958]